MDSTIKILLSVASEAFYETAELAAKDLFEKFSISDVTIRSSSAPVDRLLHVSTKKPSSILWVFLSGDGCDGARIIQEESPYPVLQIHPDAKPLEISWQIAKWCSLGCKKVAMKVQQISKQRRQARLVEDAQLQTKSWKYHQAIAKSFDERLQVVGSGVDSAIQGKVRDRIELNSKQLALVTTDRQSGFDRQLALVPFKGAVLNLTSAFWFEQTKHIIPNHVIEVPHPYVTISKKCEPFPIEFVVR